MVPEFIVTATIGRWIKPAYFVLNFRMGMTITAQSRGCGRIGHKVKRGKKE
jgi:hypothetical protein